MTMLLFATITSALLGWLMGFLSVFLILLVLIQRGRGGGLTGALGGAGGQSAFGSKAGDTFTVITVVVASVWGFSCAFTMWLLGTHTPQTADTDPTVTAVPSDDESPQSRSDEIEDLLKGAEGDPAEEDAANGDRDEPLDFDLELTPADESEDADSADEASDAADAADETSDAESDIDDANLEDPAAEPPPENDTPQ